MRRFGIFVFVLLLCLVPAFAITNTVFSDVDGDGDLDVFLETYLENNGSMNFIVRNVTSGIPQLTGVTQAYFVDVGFTAAEDLYIVRSGLQNLLYFSLGNGSFVNVTNTSLGVNLTGSPSVNTGTVFADFDSDGDYDAFASGQFFVSTGGNFANLNCTSESNLGELPGMLHMYAADMNGDLTQDIVGVTVAGSTRLMLNVGDSNGDLCPEFYEAQTDVQLDQFSGVNFASVGNISSGVAINDTLTYYPFSGVPPPFMADNFTDLYLARSSENILAIQIWPETPTAYSAGGNAQFNLPRFADKSDNSNVNISAATTSSLIADFDSNGFNDVLVGGAASNSNIYLRNFSSWNQTFLLDTTTGLPSIANMKMVQAADLDSDSALDLAIIDAQQICDGSITSAGSSEFQTTGAPGMSADPGPGGASVSDVTSDLVLSSQLDNIVLSNSSPFIVFIDAFEIAVNALTGHSIVTGGNFDCSLVTFSSEAGPEVTLSLFASAPSVVQGGSITLTLALDPTVGTPVDVVATNTLPPGAVVTFESPASSPANVYTFAGSLNTTQNVTLIIDTSLVPVGTQTDSFVVTWEDESGNFYSANISVSFDVDPPDIVTSVAGDPTVVTQGNNIVYTINVTPTGEPRNVTVVNTLPTGVTFVSSSPANTSADTWDLGNITVVTQINITASTVGAPLGIATDVVDITWADNNGDPYSDQVNATNLIVGPPPTTVDVVKSGPAAADPGDVITYTIDISVSSNNATNVTFNDTLPANVTFVSASPANTSDGPSWALGDLAVGSSTQINVTVSIDLGFAGTLTNIVSAEYTNATGGIQMSGDSFNTAVPIPAPGSSGSFLSGGGGGFSRLQQLLIVDKVTVNNMGNTYVIDGLSYGDDLKIAGISSSSIQFDGFVLSNYRLQKAQSVLVQLGNIKQNDITDSNGRFSLLVPDLSNLVQSDQGKALAIWFNPRLSQYPSGDARIGATYSPDYVDNPTLNFISPYPGLQFPGDFEQGVWFNGVPLSPVQGYVPPIEAPVMPPVPGAEIPETPVKPPVVAVPEVEPEAPGLFGSIFKLISDLIKTVIETVEKIVGIVPEVPSAVPGPSIILPPPPGVPVDCNLACTFDGSNAIFTYSPAGCGADFVQECQYAYQKGTPEFNKYVNAQMDACCALAPPGVSVPGEGPFPGPEWPPVPPPAEIPKCKLVCDLSGNTAKYSYVPTGNLDCKADFTVSCGYAGQAPKYEPKPGDPQASEADAINGMLDACCNNEKPTFEGEPEPTACKIVCLQPGEVGGQSAKYGRVPGGELACEPTPFFFGCSLPPGDPNYPAGMDLTKADVAACCDIPPDFGGACIEKRTPYCAVEGLWLTGGLGSKEIIPAVYAVLVERIPDPKGTLACIPSWTETGQAPYDAAGGTDDCISIDYCGFATRYACVDGGGAFRQDSGEVGPQCADGADGDNGGGSTFPCDPCTDQQFFKCGSVVENAYFIGMGGGAKMPVDAPLQAVVGQANYDACCGSDGTLPALYAAECSTTASQSACSYYSTYKGLGLPFFRSNTVETSGTGCEEESSTTNYEQCVCTDMLYEYGACGSSELNAKASVSYEAGLVRSSCCPSAFVPGNEPFIPNPTPGIVPFRGPPPETPPIETPPPNVPPIETPPPTVPPTITPIERPVFVPRPAPPPSVAPPAISINNPPAIDFCVPADAASGVKTEIISNDEAETILESSEAAFPEEYVPQDYTLIESVRVDACQSQQLAFKRSISNTYQDVRVFRCQNGVCSWVSDNVNEDASCEGSSLEQIMSGDVSRVVEVSQMGIITTIGEEVSSNDRSVSSGLYSIEFPGDLPSGVVGLGRPDAKITLPRNTGLVLVGTPLVITVESASKTARLTMPVTPIEIATSYSIFGLMGSSWIEVGGNYDASLGVIVADVNNFDQFVKNKKAVFAVMAYTSQAKSDSCVMMNEGNNDELIVLVHGFTSNKNTWNPLVTQAKLNNEPYDIVAFQYSPDDTTDSAATSLMSCLSTVAGNYRSYNIVAHSVGAVITNKALTQMNDNPDAYPTIYTVDKVISLGMPNKGIDVFVMNRLADVLANYPSVASVFDRRSVIARELVNPEWSDLKSVPSTAQHIGVAGTVDCDFSQLLSDVSEGPAAGGAFNIIDPIQRFTRANDCVVTVKNALEHIENQELCSNTFTPNVWHIALNDDSTVRQLIFYLINSEKAKADPTRGFAGYNQYVSWVDGCAPGTVYGIVGKEATAKKPLFCNCGDGVCDASIGETENSCPIDCYGWNMFLCTLLKNLSNVLLLLFSGGFLTYAIRKHAMNKEVNTRRWRAGLWATLGTAAAMLLIAAMLCPTMPIAALLLTALLGGLLLAENTLSRTPKEPPSKPSKPLKGFKAQVSMENEAKLSEWEQKFEELKRREKILKKYKV